MEYRKLPHGGEDVSVLGVSGSWYRVSVGGDAGYIRSDYVDLTNSASSNRDIVETAKQYLGTRYVYGGSSPSG